MPLPAELRADLKSRVADLANVTPHRWGGMLAAGIFLKEFVPANTAWAHLDIAGPMFKDKDWKYYEAGALGFGVKSLVDLCERFHDPLT